MQFFIKDFFSKCDQIINGKLQWKASFLCCVALWHTDKTSAKLVKSVIVSCSRFIKSQILVITSGFELRISCIRSIYITHEAIWSNGLGNYFVYSIFAVQSLVWSQEFVIQINHEHDTIAVWSWKYLTTLSQFEVENISRHYRSLKLKISHDTIAVWSWKYLTTLSKFEVENISRHYRSLKLKISQSCKT